MMHHQEGKLAPLVAKIKDGDQSGLAALYDQLGDRFFRYALVRLRDRELALDAVQDSLVAIWEALPGMEYRSDAETYGFLFTIVRRRVLAIADKETRRRSHEHPEAEPDTLGAEAKHVDPFLVRQLEAALAKLGDRAAEVMRLRYWGGLSFGEIGAALHMSETAVRVMHHRTHSKLEAYLTQS